MAYQKTVWKDQDVENPRTYVMRDNGNNTVTLLDAFGTVTELGTPVNAENMNKIENGITDVESSLQAQVNTKANDADVVHKTGNENITGLKIFNDVIAVRNTNYAYNEIPPSTSYASYHIRDKNGYMMGALEFLMYADGAHVFQINTRGKDNNWANPIGLGKSSSGVEFTYCPACDWDNSIVTTISKSRSQNGGYFKLGNGLIIQWGSVALNGQHWATVTLPTAFTRTNYSIALSSAEVGWTQSVTHQSRNKTTTTFETLGQGSPLSWIAIGY